MLRFLGIRLLQAIPVLLVMSIITFTIINAPPGDYADFIRNNMITQGNASIAAAEEAAEPLPRDPRPERSAADPVFPLDLGHRQSRRFRPFLLL